MKETPVRFAEVRPGERFLIRHVPSGKEWIPENAVGEPIARGIRALCPSDFAAILCRASDWAPIGTMKDISPEIEKVFVLR